MKPWECPSPNIHTPKCEKPEVGTIHRNMGMPLFLTIHRPWRGVENFLGLLHSLCPGPFGQQAAVLSLAWMLPESDCSKRQMQCPHNGRALPQDLSQSRNDPWEMFLNKSPLLFPTSALLF
jgi:hypothetical protein